jgi:hypothetical protein
VIHNIYLFLKFADLVTQDCGLDSELCDLISSLYTFEFMFYSRLRSWKERTFFIKEDGLAMALVFPV